MNQDVEVKKMRIWTVYYLGKKSIYTRYSLCFMFNILKVLGENVIHIFSLLRALFGSDYKQYSGRSKALSAFYRAWHSEEYTFQDFYTENCCSNLTHHFSAGILLFSTRFRVKHYIILSQCSLIALTKQGEYYINVILQSRLDNHSRFLVNLLGRKDVSFFNAVLI